MNNVSTATDTWCAASWEGPLRDLAAPSSRDDVWVSLEEARQVELGNAPLVWSAAWDNLFDPPKGRRW